MKRKAIILAGTVVVLSTLATTAFAVEPIKGGNMTPPSNVVTSKPLIDNAVSSSQPVSETSKEVVALQQQIALLEAAIAPKSAREAAEKWGKALSDRNGAFQYALFTKQLKENTKPYFEQGGWVTGGSSPWIENYQITETKKISDANYEYTLVFTLTDSTKQIAKENAKVIVQQADGNWYIEKVVMQPNTVIGYRTPYVKFPLETSDTFIYRTAEYAFSIPKSWDTKYHAFEKDGKLIFNYKSKNTAISERFLFSVEKIKEETWKKGGYEEGLHRKLGTKNGYVYAMLGASENQYADRQDSVEYKDFDMMCLQFKLITETFMIGHQ